MRQCQQRGAPLCLSRPEPNTLLQLELQHILTTEAREMIVLRVSTDGQDQLDVRQCGKKAVMPGAAALATRREVAFVSGMPRKAKAHGGDQHLAAVVEARPIDTHPIPQALAGRIVEGQTACMRPDPRRLTGNQQARRGIDAQDRAGFVRQRRTRERGVPTKTAGPNGTDEVQEGVAGAWLRGRGGAPVLDGGQTGSFSGFQRSYWVNLAVRKVFASSTGPDNLSGHRDAVLIFAVRCFLSKS